MTQLIASRSLSCGYAGTGRQSDRIVLTDVSFEVPAGDVVALLGPNGSGKTTLLRTLCGSVQPLSGEVEVSGTTPLILTSHSKHDTTEMARRVALVPQEEPAAYPFSVRELVTLGRLPHSVGVFDTAEDRAIAEAAMTRADCLSLADRSIDAISGGEKQRALIARSLAQGASVLLLDEPTTHLDPAHQRDAVLLTRELAQEGRAIVAAVHDFNLAARMATRAMVLSNGKVVLSGDIECVLEDTTLDDVFSMRFQRFKAPDGRLVVLSL